MSHALGAHAWAVPFAFGVLALCALLAFYRIARGPSLPDRIVGFDLLTVITVGILGTASVAYDRPVLLDAAIVLALVTFIATVALSRLIVRRAPQEEQVP